MSCEGKWIAYDESGEKPVAVDSSGEKAFDEAKSKGVEHPVLAFCPPEGCTAFYGAR
ncbi:MAG: hypothetical protein GTN49_09775 [candidate division Zixibacteria bacterium]|nr:hypothetical protein [candidate division Zixibacteria bacterium]